LLLQNEVLRAAEELDDSELLTNVNFATALESFESAGSLSAQSTPQRPGSHADERALPYRRPESVDVAFHASVQEQVEVLAMQVGLILTVLLWWISI